MTVIDDDLLAYFRSRPNCELCGTRSPGRLDPHHILTRGHGGGSRLDVPLNLCALCPDLYGGQCHTRFGDDPTYQRRFLDLIAKREGLESGEVVLEALWRLLREPKRARA